MCKGHVVRGSVASPRSQGKPSVAGVQGSGAGESEPKGQAGPDHSDHTEDLGFR